LSDTPLIVHDHRHGCHGPHKHHHPHCNETEPADDVSSAESQVTSYDAVTDVEDYSSSANGATAASSRSLSLWMIVAGVAAGTALAAAALGSRKQPKETHMLEGSVKRRMGLFSTFADSACGTATRPERVVELTDSRGGDYRLA
jgi:hypothetical protein